MSPQTFSKLRLLLLYAAAYAWCFGLLMARAVHSESLHFSFLIWNLFLASIPLAITLALGCTRRGIPAMALLAAWLLFFPNAPYVITDLLHLKPHSGVALWFDLLLLVSFAVVSLFLGMHSLRNVQRWLISHSHPAISWAVVIASLFLSGFGIYLGRFLRWNSWDVVAQPLSLMADISDRILNPMSHPRTWAVTMGFGFLLTLIYLFSISLIPLARQQATHR